MRVELDGKVALVTGASAGIGRAIAIALAASGAQVAINFRKNEDGAGQTLRVIQDAKGHAWTYCADVSDPGAVGCMFVEISERVGGVDILVNNAADPVASQPIEEWTPELWDRALAVNLRSVFLCTQAAIPVMKQRRWGRIINISSIGAAAGGTIEDRKSTRLNSSH